MNGLLKINSIRNFFTNRPNILFFVALNALVSFILYFLVPSLTVALITAVIAMSRGAPVHSEYLVLNWLFSKLDSGTHIMIMLASMIALGSVAGNIISFYKSKFISTIGKENLKKLRHQVYDYLMKVKFLRSNESDREGFVMMALDDTRLVNSHLVTFPHSVIRISLDVIVCIYFVASNSWILGAYFLVTSPLVTAYYYKRSKKLKRMHQDAAHAKEIYTKKFYDGARSCRATELYELDQLDRQREQELSHAYASSLHQIQIRGARLDTAVTVLQDFSMIGLLAILSYFLMRGTISEGVIFVAPTLFGKLLANFRSLLGKLTEYRVAEAARERLDHICDGQFVNIMQRKSIQRGQPTIAKEAAFLIKLENAAFSYGSQVILSAASLSIEARKRYCVVGQNGAGKSTLIDILLGYQPVEGIHFSIDMSQASVCSRYFNLPDVPVCELMTCMSKHEYFNKEAVGELIHALDVEHLQERPLSRMSLGEQQRIRILFALLKDAEIYIFDEPLAHIALIDHPAIMQLILRRTREKTIIIVSHEPYSSEEHFDEIIEIKNKTLLTNPAKARHYA